MKNFKTNESATVTNYPYGYLKTSATFSLDFKPSHGFRSVFQTVNPKTGRINAPKKGTYSPAMIMQLNKETGHVGYISFSFNGAETLNKNCASMFQYFDLFTPEQIKSIYAYLIMMLKVEMSSICTYCGANIEDVKPILLPVLNTIMEGYKTGCNVFDKIIIDIEKLNACKVPDFNPFRVVEHTNILNEGMSNPHVTQISDHDKRQGETLETIQAEESAKAVIRETLKY